MKWVIKAAYFILLLIVTIAILCSCRKDENNPVNTQQDNLKITESLNDNKEDDINTEASEGNENRNSLTDNNKLEPDEKDTDIMEENKQNIDKSEPDKMRDISSVELVKELKIGWNLGNTLDATGGNGILSEISWGNPKTTKEMIDTVKEAGFHVLRIPTTWEKHLGSAPNYIIDKAWLNRVKEVVDYAVNKEMYVILNMHHEEWHFPSYDNYEIAKDILVKVWSQIADCFENYNEHLIFEGMNEPRMKGTNYEWNGGTEEGRDVVNKLNSDFVQTIRSAGVNNPLRHLMIPSYAASSDIKTWKDLTIPEDDKIIISIHAYTPYNFALNGGGTDRWSTDNVNDTREIDALFNNIDQYFISKGIPVILGEFGARNKDNLSSRVAWAEYYVRKAKEKGVPCIWWDNGAFHGDGENFGLLNRRGLIWEYPEIIDALMNGIK